MVTALSLLPFITFWFTGAATLGPLIADLIASYFLLWGLAALRSRTPQDELRRRFLLLTATLIFTLALLEVPGALAIVDYRSVFSTPSHYGWEAPGKVFDDELLWRTRAHYQQHIKYTGGNIGEAVCLPPGPEREYDLRYDQNGFRNAEDFVTADIAVIGDSYVEAETMEHSHIMTSVLARLQKKTVVNLGMSGYGPQHELIVFKRYVPQLYPKTVVWVFYGGNDLYDVKQYKRDKEIATSKSGLSNLWNRTLIKNLLLAASRALQKCIPRPYDLRCFGIIRDAEGQHRRYFVGTNSDLVPLDLSALETTRSIIKEANHLSEERGIHLVVVYAPDAISVYHGLSNLIEVSDEVKRWEISDLPDRLRAMVADISPKINYLDLTSVLKSAAEKGIPIFLPDDTHWTQDGHRIVAEAVNRLLSSTPLQDRILMSDQPQG
jgi:lysophospholipase L1-like esterase